MIIIFKQRASSRSDNGAFKQSVAAFFASAMDEHALAATCNEASRKMVSHHKMEEIQQHRSMSEKTTRLRHDNSHVSSPHQLNAATMSSLNVLVKFWLTAQRERLIWLVSANRAFRRVYSGNNEIIHSRWALNQTVKKHVFHEKTMKKERGQTVRLLTKATHLVADDKKNVH